MGISIQAGPELGTDRQTETQTQREKSGTDLKLARNDTHLRADTKVQIENSGLLAHEFVEGFCDDDGDVARSVVRCTQILGCSYSDSEIHWS